MIYMTPSELSLAKDAILYLRGQKFPVSRILDMQAYVDTWAVENRVNLIGADTKKVADKLFAYIDSYERRKAAEERASSTTKEAGDTYKTAFKTVMDIVNQGEDRPLGEILLAIYSHPACVEYYKSEEGLWLMTTIIQHVFGHYAASHKTKLFQAARAANLNGINDTISSKEF